MNIKFNYTKIIPLQTGEADIVRTCVLQKGHKVLQTSKRSVEGANRNAFTLAEVLITLGVIGVVAAVTMPSLLTNVQERVRKEQVRTVKYKFTKATEKMNSLGKIVDYGDDNDATKNFVNELKNHLSIAKVCENNNLAQCWPSGGFTDAKGNNYSVSGLTTGVKLEALQMNSGGTKTMGIVTGDGTPIILVYGKDCQALDEAKQYQWSTVDGKPETNATAGCVSMVFDINGAKGPNKIGTDVRTLNSLLGMVELGYDYAELSQAECEKHHDKLGIKSCLSDDYWAGAVKACHDLGLHLPSMATIAQIATMTLGVPVDTYENVCVWYEECHSWSGYHFKPIPENYSSPITYIEEPIWSGEEIYNQAYYRDFGGNYTAAEADSRNEHMYTLCVGD